jgi:hypothetical protein
MKQKKNLSNYIKIKYIKSQNLPDYIRQNHLMILIAKLNFKLISQELLVFD